MRKNPRDKASGLPKGYVKGLSASTAKARKAHWERMDKLSDRDPRSYEPAPGDATAKTVPSKATREIRKIMNKEEVEINEAAETSLAAKAKKFGVPLGTLKTVYRRGVAAWNSGHRPGTTPQQWGHARVNSYLRKGKGTYHGADKDLRKEEVQIDEISKKTLDSYSKKSFTQYMNATHGPTDWNKQSEKVRDKAAQRMKGMNMADRKMGKSLIKAKVAATEEVQIDEISKDTLKSYLSKAGSGKQYRNSQAFRNSMLSQDLAKAKIAKKPKKNIKVKATEEVQIDELSKNTLKSYVGKADARLMDRTIDNPKAHKKAQNRTFGIEKAMKKIGEEAPVNTAGSGNVAGLQGEPPVHMKKKKNIMTFSRFMKK